ncbi:MAG: hypothetical protein ACXVW6_08090 [Nocardioidaceae bacterium]
MIRLRATRGRNQVSRWQMNMDILVGILGFLALTTFISTVSAEVHGRPALRLAVALFMLVVLLFLAVRLRHRH